MESSNSLQNSFASGLRDGIPIGLGYFSVSMTFGILCVMDGLPIWAAAVISMTNLTSAGQFAGLSLICAHSSLLEMALTQLIINLRYALMSLSLSQKLSAGISLPGRLGASYFITDEIFAVAASQPGEVGGRYLAGLAIMPYLGWSLGTLCGAVASGFLPESVRSAFGIALYGMFIAIVIPVVRQSRAVLGVVVLAVFLSCAIRFAPLLSNISSGFSIILCTVVAAGAGALLAPVSDAEEASDHANA